MMFLCWIRDIPSFREFSSQSHAEAYIASCKRFADAYLKNAPRRGWRDDFYKCEAVDMDAECSGVTGDPRCTGRWCTCNV